jgi:hypothetical protein
MRNKDGLRKIPKTEADAVIASVLSLYRLDPEKLYGDEKPAPKSTKS